MNSRVSEPGLCLSSKRNKAWFWGKATFLQAQKAEEIQEQEKTLLKVSMKIPINPEIYSEPSQTSM